MPKLADYKIIVFSFFYIKFSFYFTMMYIFKYVSYYRIIMFFYCTQFIILFTYYIVDKSIFNFLMKC